MKSVSAQKNFSLRVDEVAERRDRQPDRRLQRDADRDPAARHGPAGRQRSPDVAHARSWSSEVAERLRAQDELKTLNTTLEQRVAERSAAAEQRAEELARSKEALQKQTRILQSILDSMSDGVIVADDEGRVIVSNPAAAEILRVEAAATLDADWPAPASTCPTWSRRTLTTRSR